ncbi:MAG: hypothetical protein ACXV5N_09410 [Halobacteriota archaeon]
MDNLKAWLYTGTDDRYVIDTSYILLDSGTSKIVNWLGYHYPNDSPSQLVEKFVRCVQENEILNKYTDVVNSSGVNKAVTFDLPNTFKIRSKNGKRRTIKFNVHDKAFIRVSINYANQLYRLLEDEGAILTTINGNWTKEELDLFFHSLEYAPTSLAVGGLAGRKKAFAASIRSLDRQLDLGSFSHVHFLGCGGIDNVNSLKAANLNSEHLSVDCSTPWNRAVDGNKKGTSFSGYYDYNNGNQLVRINPYTRQDILARHSRAANRLLSMVQATVMLDTILQHQRNNSSTATYDARALLAIHNHHVFKENAL